MGNSSIEHKTVIIPYIPEYLMHIHDLIATNAFFAPKQNGKMSQYTPTFTIKDNMIDVTVQRLLIFDMY